MMVAKKSTVEWSASVTSAKLPIIRPITSLTTASEKLATSEMNAVRSFRVMAGPALPPFLVPVKGFGHSRPGIVYAAAARWGMMTET
jgi:hypothetical protein